MIENKTCPKCDGNMKVGSYTGAVIDWEDNGNPAFLKQPGHKIHTYACEACGYMESYVGRE